MWLVLACVVPAVLIVSAVIGYYYVRERDQIAENTLRSVRALTLAVDQQFAAVTSGLSVLATSRALDRDDLLDFYNQAQEMVRVQPISSVVLAHADAQQVVNTRAPFGDPLPQAPAAPLRAIVLTGQPAVGALTRASIGAGLIIPVGVPVVRDGELAYTLTAGIPVERMQALLMSQRLPAGWIAAVVDSDGIVVARSLSPEKFVGGSAAPAVRERLAVVGEDAIESLSLEGVPVLTVFSRSESSRYTVVIGIPLATLNGELQRSVQWFVGATALAVLLMLLVTRHLSVGIVRSMRGLVGSAQALGRGERVALPRLEFREAAEVGEAIAEASDQLGRARDALVRSNIDLQQFAFVASHDLRTPLRSIHGYAQMLEKRHGEALGENGRGLLRRVTAAVGQLDTLLQDLLGYARTDSAAKAFAPVDMNEVLTATLHLLDAQVTEAGAVVAREPLPVVTGDRTQLVQLMQNLLSNAIKYHRPGVPPRVAVSALRGAGSEWVFAVRDEGIGIDPRFHDSIFEVFKRLHAAQEYPGTGIGLALCARIVRRHGGRIWVQSAEGDGSTFHFTLPGAAGDPA